MARRNSCTRGLNPVRKGKAGFKSGAKHDKYIQKIRAEELDLRELALSMGVDYR